MNLHLIVTVALLLTSLNCIAQEDNHKGGNLVQMLVDKYKELDGTPPGISVAISQNNGISFAKGFGCSDFKNNMPVTTATQFRTA